MPPEASFANADPGSVAQPWFELQETYGQFLAMSQDYVAANLIEEQPEVDLDALQHFLAARNDLLQAAEVSLASLGEEVGRVDGDSAKQEVRDRIVAVMGEMADLEAKMATFLTDRLKEMGRTIDQMKKTQPVFKRYGYLGGPVNPSRITRRE